MPHLQEKGEEENAPPTQNSTPPDSTLQDWRGNRLSEKRKSRDPGGSGAPRQECGGKSCAGGRDSEQTRPPLATAPVATARRPVRARTWRVTHPPSPGAVHTRVRSHGNCSQKIPTSLKGH